MVSCSTPAELDAGEKPAIRRAGPARSKYGEAPLFWEPWKSGGSGNPDNRRGRNMLQEGSKRSSQNRGVGLNTGTHRAGGREEEKGRQKPLPCKVSFDTSCQC